MHLLLPILLLDMGMLFSVSSFPTRSIFACNSTHVTLFLFAERFQGSEWRCATAPTIECPLTIDYWMDGRT